MVLSKKKMQISNLVCVSGITFIRYAQNRQIGKPNNVKVFESNKAKGHQQDSQNRLRSPMPEEGELDPDNKAMHTRILISWYFHILHLKKIWQHIFIAPSFASFRWPTGYNHGDYPVCTLNNLSCQNHLVLVHVAKNISINNNKIIIKENDKLLPRKHWPENYRWRNTNTTKIPWVILNDLWD